MTPVVRSRRQWLTRLARIGLVAVPGAGRRLGPPLVSTLAASTGGLLAAGLGADGLFGSAIAADGPAASAAEPPSSMPAMPAMPPAGERLFTVTLGDYTSGVRVAEVSYRLAYSAGRYQLSTSGQATGLVALVYSGQLTQASDGRIGDAGLMPEIYREKRGRRPERQLRFDWADHRMIGDGDPPSVALPDGTQDRLSLAYQLGLLARQVPARATAGARFVVPLAGMRAIDPVTITSAGPSPLRIQGDSIAAVKFEIRGDRHADDRIDIWLSPEQSMLPLRIRFVDDGNKVIDQVRNLQQR